MKACTKRMIVILLICCNCTAMITGSGYAEVGTAQSGARPDEMPTTSDQCRSINIWPDEVTDFKDHRYEQVTDNVKMAYFQNGVYWGDDSPYVKGYSANGGGGDCGGGCVAAIIITGLVFWGVIVPSILDGGADFSRDTRAAGMNFSW